MEPYYESWANSAHRDVSCVACHFEPGLRGVFWGKFAAISQVTKYFTGTAGSKPFARMSDASCLRAGCHSVEALGAPAAARGFPVRFDHRPHLDPEKVGRTMVCSSCHTQILRDEHMTTNEAACFLCHLRPGRPPELGACQRCHEPPGTVDLPGGETFDHARVVGAGVECTQCHAGLTEGRGEVPRQRCLQCHNARDQIGRFTEPVFLHERHVLGESLDCQDCHLEIRHSLREGWVREATRCETCHPDHHRAQNLLFAGEAAKGVPSHSGPMFKVRTGCLSCHVAVNHAGEEVVLTASPQACDECHQEGFGEILEGWRELGDARLEEIGASVSEARGAIAAFGGEPARREEAERRLRAVEEDLRLVRLGRPAHNFGYAEAILDAAEEEIERIRALLGDG
jgi:hypothetical protein